TRYSPDFIVETILQIRWTGMRIVFIPTGKDSFTNVRYIVAISIFQKKKVWSHGNNDTTASKDDTGWNIEVVGKYGKLISTPIAIGIFTNFHPIICGSVRFLKCIGIIYRFDHP